MQQDHQYEIGGHVNARHVHGTGRGTIDTTTGVSEMTVDFTQLPSGWDPRTIVLMCCDRALIMAAREAAEGTVGMYRASGGYLSIGRELAATPRRALMHDGNGQVMAQVAANSVTDFRSHQAYDHSTVEGGTCHLVPGINGIAHIPAFDGVMMQAGPNLVVVTTRYSAELDDGSTIHGTTTYPHYLPEQATPMPYYQLLRVAGVEQHWDGKRLTSQVTTSVLPMTPPACDEADAAVQRVQALT